MDAAGVEGAGAAAALAGGWVHRHLSCWAAAEVSAGVVALAAEVVAASVDSAVAVLEGAALVATGSPVINNA